MKGMFSVFIVIMMVAPVHAFTIGGKSISITISPDSHLWGVERAVEDLRVSMTTNEPVRLSLRLDHAEERLEEAHQMVLLGKDDAALKALDAHNHTLQRLRHDIDSFSDERSLTMSHQIFESYVERMESQRDKVLATVPSDSPARDDIEEAFEHSIEHALEQQETVLNRTKTIQRGRTVALEQLGTEIGIEAVGTKNSLMGGTPISPETAQDIVDWYNSLDPSIDDIEGKTITLQLIKNRQVFQVIHLSVSEHIVTIVDTLPSSTEEIVLNIETEKIDHYIDVVLADDEIQTTKTLIDLGGKELLSLL